MKEFSIVEKRQSKSEMERLEQPLSGSRTCLLCVARGRNLAGNFRPRMCLCRGSTRQRTKKFHLTSSLLALIAQSPFQQSMIQSPCITGAPDSTRWREREREKVCVCV